MIQYKQYHTQETDGTYEGYLNKSHQKHGFGIYRSDDFDTYFGFWKNNHLDGKGLIIYESSQILYSNFIKDKPSGTSVFDNNQKLIVGILRNSTFVGIGYQYNYSNQTWQMIQFQNFKIKKVIIQQVNDLSNGPPKIMRTELQIFTTLENYLNKAFFAQYQIYTKKGVNQIYGRMKNNQIQGLAVIFQNNEIKELGYYKKGKMNGCGYRFVSKDLQIGFYYNDYKNGLFEQYKNNHKSIVFYNQNQYINTVGLNEKINLKTEQRYFHLNNKNFISIKNSFNLRQIHNTITSTKKLINISPNKRNQNRSLEKSQSKTENIKKQQSKQIQKQKLEQLTKKKSNMSPRRLRKRTLQSDQNQNQTCLQTIKKKIPFLLGLINNSNQKQLEDHIQIQQNPFSVKKLKQNK